MLKVQKTQVLEEIKILKRTIQPGILFLLETMTNEKNSRVIIQKMGFGHFDFVLPCNHSGGIWVLWNNNNCHASVLTKDNRVIHMLVHDPGNAKNIIVTGIYRPTQTHEKDAFWNYLVQMNSVIDLPWLLVGDFNELESLTDKRGGSSPSVRRIERLNSFLTMIRAESILVNGKNFN